MAFPTDSPATTRPTRGSRNPIHALTDFDTVKYVRHPARRETFPVVEIFLMLLVCAILIVVAFLE